MGFDSPNDGKLLTRYGGDTSSIPQGIYSYIIKAGVGGMFIGDMFFNQGEDYEEGFVVSGNVMLPLPELFPVGDNWTWSGLGPEGLPTSFSPISFTSDEPA